MKNNWKNENSRLKIIPEFVPSSVASLLAIATNQLKTVSESPSLDAQVLLAHQLAVPRSWLLAHPEMLPSENQSKDFFNGLARLVAGEPLPYVLGHWEFYGLDFVIHPGVLIPRPETELLVEQSLKWLSSHSNARHVIDVGAGSGCIAVSLAVHRPDLIITACDISAQAVRLARSNAQKHAVLDRMQVLQSDLLEPLITLEWKFDLIVANLPYIPSGHLQDLTVARHEPRLALDGGPDGLALIRRLLSQASALLAPGALMLLEIEASQGIASAAIAQTAFPSACVEVYQDLAGHDRLVKIQNL